VLNTGDLLRTVTQPSTGELAKAWTETHVSRYRVSPMSSFDNFRRGNTITRSIQACAGIMFCFGLLTYVVSSQGDPGHIAGIPIPAVAILLVGMLIWIPAALTQTWHARIRPITRAEGVDVYVIGRTPIGSGYMVLGPNALTLLNREHEVWAQMSLSEVAGVATLESNLGIGCVIRWRDTYLELPIVLKVGGSTAQAWSLDGLIGRGRLLAALRTDLANRGVRTVTAS